MATSIGLILSCGSKQMPRGLRERYNQSHRPNQSKGQRKTLPTALGARAVSSLVSRASVSTPSIRIVIFLFGSIPARSSALRQSVVSNAAASWRAVACT